jgi:hypothetical protein
LPGGLTGQLWLGGFQWKFAGTLNAENRFSATVANPSFYKIAEISLQVAAGAGPVVLEATISLDGKTTEKTLTQPNVKKAAAAAGTYTFVIPAKREWESLAPIYSEIRDATIEHPLRTSRGDGVGQWRVLAKGSAIGTGRLPDGEPFTASYLMDDRGRLQVFSTLYPIRFTSPEPQRGWIRGLVNFRDVADTSDADGTLQWNITSGGGPDTRPDARESVTIMASRYKAPESLQDLYPVGVNVHIGDVDLPRTGTAQSLGNRLMSIPPLRINGSLNVETGDLRGHLGLTDADAWTMWWGVVFQKQGNTIFGQHRRFGPMIWGKWPVGSGGLRMVAP